MAYATLRTILGFLVLFLSTLSFGQALFHGEAIGPASDKLNAEERGLLASAFRDHSVFRLDGSAINALVHEAKGTVALRLVLGDRYDWDLQLEQHDLRTREMVVRVATGNGVQEVPAIEARTYKGHVRGTQEGLVRFSVRDGLLMGCLMAGDEDHFIEPLAHITGGMQDDRYVVYRMQDVILASGVSCGVTSMQEIAAPREGGARGGDDCRLANIAIAADGSMTAFLGGTTGVQNRVNDILNWVDGKYQEPSIAIAYQLVTLFISSSTANDPWSAGQDASALLGSFRTWGNGGGFGPGITYAVATLWTRRDITANGSSGVIGLAYVGTICTNSRYNLCEHYSTSMTGPTIV